MTDDLVKRLRAVVPTVYDAHDAADEIERLQARVAELEAERGKELRFDLVRFENGQFDFRGGPVPAIANYFAQMFDAGEGKYFNHMEIEFDHPEAGPMVLSAQRRNGETPNQQRLAAQARAEAAEAYAAELEAKLAKAVVLLGQWRLASAGHVSVRSVMDKHDATLAELTGDKDE